MNIRYYDLDPQVRCGTTLRSPTLPEEGNMALHSTKDPNGVAENRLHFCAIEQLRPAQFVMLNQTHSNHVVKVDAALGGKGFFEAQDAIADCDALFTTESNLVIGVFTADCVPILLFDPTTKTIAAIHAGWKSTAKNIVQATLQALQANGVDPCDLLAYVAPSITQANFQISKEVIDEMQDLPIDLMAYVADDALAGKYRMDVAGINIALLMHYGVSSTHIQHDSTCTFEAETTCFSYRRDASLYRHYHFIYLR